MYSSSKDLLEETKLKSVGEYIYERCHNVRVLTEGIIPMMRKCKEWDNTEETRTERKKKGWCAYLFMKIMLKHCQE